jgi:hypothetical protein
VTPSKTRGSRGSARKDPWLLVKPAARLAGCSPQTIYSYVLGKGRKGKDYRYVGGFLFVHERAALLVKEQLAASRAAEGAA